MNIFESVKSAVDIKAAAEYYGVTVRRDMAICPFHDEKTASMKLYGDHFHCFGCSEHGDVIKLTGKLLGLSPAESAKRLAADFNVTGYNSFSSGESRPKPVKIVTQREKENRAYKLISEYISFLERCRIAYAPRSPDEELHPLFVRSLTELEMFRYFRDIFINESWEERMAFIEENAGLLGRIETELYGRKAA